MRNNTKFLFENLDRPIWQTLYIGYN